MKKIKEEYHVALSFAEEDRPFVDCVAQKLKDKGLKIFYDDHERIKLWGRDLYTLLDDIYRNKARFCLLFISKHYKEKCWTQHERRSALLRALKEKEDYILPFRFDDTDILEIRRETVYLSSTQFDCTQLADAIADKVRFDEERRLSNQIINFFSRHLRLTIATVTTGSLVILGLFDKLTPVDKLTHQIHEKSGMHIDGAVCNDGELSYSNGQGACSSHKGIDYDSSWIEYEKTIEECRKEAEEISWLP